MEKLVSVSLAVGDENNNGKLDLKAKVSLLKNLFNKEFVSELDQSTVLDKLAEKAPALGGAVDDLKKLLSSKVTVELGDGNADGMLDLSVKLSLLNGAIDQKFSHDFKSVSLFSLILSLGPALAGIVRRK